MALEQKGSKGYYGWVIVFLGLMVMALVFVSSFSVNSLFVVSICEDFGISRAALSLYLSISNVAMLVSAPFMGKLMAKYGFKRMGTFSIVLLAVCIALLSFAPNIYFFYVVAVFRGVGYCGGTSMLVNVMVNNWFGPKMKGTAMGVATFGSSVGGFVIMPMVTQIINNFSWRWGYRALGILIIVIMVPLMLLLAVETPEKKGLARLGDLDGGKVSLVGPTMDVVKKTPSFWLICVGFCIMILTTGALSSQAVAYLTDLGISSTTASSIQSTGLLLMVMGKLAIGRINDKFGGKAAMAFGMLCLIGSYVSMYSLTLSTKLVPVYVIFYALGQAIGLLAPTVMITAVFGNKSFAAIIGYTTLANGLGNAIGPVFMGGVYDITGSYSIGWITLAVLAALSWLLIGIAMRSDYKKADAQPAA